MSDELNLLSLNKLAKILQQYESAFSVTNKRQLLFAGDLLEIQGDLQEIDISVVNDPDGHVLDLNNLRNDYQIIFYKWIDQDLDTSSIDKNLWFLKTNGDFIIIRDGSLLNSSGNTEFENEIGNILSYYKLCNFLKSETVSDHHNEIKEEYVFYSSSKGVIRIKYDTIAPRIKTVSYTLMVEALIKIIGEQQYKSYFVNTLFQIAKGGPSVDLIEIIKIAHQLISIIKRDYELVIKQFDFEKFKDRLLKEKEKYFNSIREILNKVFSQLIGIPISISASAFATYKVENETPTLVMILVGFVFYIIFYIRIQLIYKKDINELSLDFNRDFEIIRDRSGLPPDIIDSEHRKIIKKISQTKSMINFLIIGILILGGSFAFYLGNQIVNILSVEYCH